VAPFKSPLTALGHYPVLDSRGPNIHHQLAGPQRRLRYSRRWGFHAPHGRKTLVLHIPSRRPLGHQGLGVNSGGRNRGADAICRPVMVDVFVALHLALSLERIDYRAR
jgi:hypothetical protein